MCKWTEDMAQDYWKDIHRRVGTSGYAVSERNQIEN